MPGDPPSTPKTPGREETVSKRTRSKFNLQTKPIEQIQLEYIDHQPDDSKLVDLDESWQEFLKEFQKPLRE